MKRNYIMAGIAIFCWSTLPPMTKVLLVDLSNMEVLFISSAIAFLFLLLFNCKQKNIQLLTEYTYKDVLIQIGLGFIGMFLYSALYYFSLTELSSQDACIINYLWPIMVIVFSAPILNEKVTGKKAVAIVLSFLGLIIIITKGHFTSLEMGNVKGIIACVAAAVCYGLFNVLNKKADYEQAVGMMIYFGVTAVAAGICFVYQGNYQPVTAIQIGGLLWLGIFIDAIAFLLWALALKDCDTAKISNLAYLTPFLTIVFSAALFNEKIHIYSVMGLLFIIAGIVVQNVL